ncbi:hypothetical protein BGZ94_000798 [Podila epigama]|nr:hypothetical protein BGZ94_000798 [Podila epigama]
MSKHYSDDYDSDDDNNSEDQTKTNPLVTQQTASTSTQLSSTPKTPATAASLCAVTGHSLVRAKSYSQFETSRKSITSPTAIAAVVDTTLNTTYSYPSIPATFPQPHTAAHGHQHLLGHSDMSTRDWVKMQSRINELEMQVSHVSRANQLLNQELDKVNSHLMRLTSNDLDDHHGQGGGETWRREYEFLVDQVELMHRQLQLAQSPQYQYQLLMQSQQIQQHQYHNQSQSQSQSPSTMVPAVDQTEISRQLHSSVRELTQSLRSWQTAFQEAEEKYRRKCEGERALKQTLQERESQLSALVSKLSNYERDFQQSIAGYTHQIDTLLTRPAMTEMNTKCSHQDTHTTNIHMDTDNANSGVSLDMPGTFPQQSDDTPEGDPFSVLSWAALLATYMLS